MTKKLFALLASGLALAAIPAAGHPPVETADTLQTAAATSHRPFTFRFGTDIMSSYVSRGSFQAGPSFQPALTAGYGKFFFDAWGSIDFTASQMQEVNLSVAYRTPRFTFAITDYYIAPHPSAPGRFFQFDHTSTHTFEASVSWTVSHKVPIGIWWGTMFAGADVNNNEKRNFSSYARIFYPFSVKKVIDMETGIGFFPWSTENCFNTKGFAVTNVYLHASHQWVLRGDIRLGILARLICNPYRGQFNFVGGVSFHM